MHASPTFQITVRHFGVWRVVSISTILVSALTTGAWLFSLGPDRPIWVWAFAALFATCAGWIVVDCWQIHPHSLRWDTQKWHLGSSATLGWEPVAGRVVVALDLGPWILLRFVRDQGPRWRRRTWLPVQRRGHEAQWHAFRCAVYSARSALASTATASRIP
jgi:hypothetical protein